MEYLLKRISYLQGLCDGYDLDTTTNEGKIISELVDILSDVIDEMRESREEIEDYVDIIEEDLADLEDYVYENDDIDFELYDDDFARRATMTIHKKGQAHWEGDIKRGKGTVSTESGVLNQQPYGFNTRFEGEKGTNPEELIGAAHAACFSMALSLMLGEAGFTPTSIDTTADVSLDKVDAGFAITKIALKSEVAVPGIDASTFDGIIQKAKAGCPVSQVLKAEITLDYQLKS